MRACFDYLAQDVELIHNIHSRTVTLLLSRADLCPSLGAARAQAAALLRQSTARYHDGWLRCTDATCAHRTRNIVCGVYRDGDQACHGLSCPISGAPTLM